MSGVVRIEYRVSAISNLTEPFGFMFTGLINRGGNNRFVVVDAI